MNKEALRTILIQNVGAYVEENIPEEKKPKAKKLLKLVKEHKAIPKEVHKG